VTTKDPDGHWPPAHSSRRRFVLTTVLAAVGVLVSVLAWRFPVEREPDASSDQRGQTSAGVHTGQPTSAGTPSPSPSPSPSPASADQMRYLNTITPEEGSRYLAPLPAGLPQTSEYAHAVTIACPSNQTGDKVRELKYPLNQRYLALSGTVTARLKPSVSVPDPQVELTSVASERQRDGTLRATGNQSGRATGGHPSPITLAVAGAEKLTVRISCEVPDGVVILTDARLTLAH
jgi:hypothetical protein